MTATMPRRAKAPITGNKTTTRLTDRDRSVMDMLSAQAEMHDSGGTYSMVAAYVKHSTMIVGYNRLRDPASQKSKHYHPRNGRHCELHLVTQAKALGNRLRGGTIYVAGRRNSPLPNTSPCLACRKTLKDSGSIRSLVYYLDGKLVKEIL